MPKRTKSERIERYKRKLRDLEKSETIKRRRIRTISSSDESDQGNNPVYNRCTASPIMDVDESPADDVLPDNVPDEVTQSGSTQQAGFRNISAEIASAASPLVPSSPNPATTSAHEPASLAVIDTAASATNLSAPAAAAATTSDLSVPPAATEPSLDPTLLAALGELTNDTPDFGPSIHDSLANIWLPLLKKGTSKENRDKLLKEYLVPSNCKLLQAPKLNAEISAAVSEVVRGRDKKYVGVQQQLGQGIAAINRAMDVLLKSDSKVEALKYLSDGCRILSDLHHFFTKDRSKLVTPSLDKGFLQVLQDAERDETLFGNTLPEKIKASKAIEKQGHQIKKSINFSTPRANTPSSTNTRPSTSQGNWSGPPRYSSNRGGRGANRRTNPPATRRPYISAAAPPRPPPQAKARATARQH